MNYIILFLFLIIGILFLVMVNKKSKGGSFIRSFNDSNAWVQITNSPFSYYLTPTEHEINQFIKWDRFRILPTVLGSTDKKLNRLINKSDIKYPDKYTWKHKSVIYPRETLNPTLPQNNKACRYCVRLFEMYLTSKKSIATAIMGVGSKNCEDPFVIPSKKCSKGNLFTLVVPNLHISMPWNNRWVADTADAGLGNNFLFNIPTTHTRTFVKILYKIREAALTWGQNQLSSLYDKGILDRHYTCIIGKLSENRRYYDAEELNTPASRGGSPIGTIFPYFHYPNSPDHKLGRIFEHIHLQVPLRITDNGFSHDDLLQNKMHPTWDAGLKFMENNITGQLGMDIEGDNSGKTFDYTLDQVIRDRDINLIHPRDNMYHNCVENMRIGLTRDLTGAKMIDSSHVINSSRSQYDSKTNLYMITIPKGTILYRGFHSVPGFALACRNIKSNGDPSNYRADMYTWYGGPEIAITYAWRNAKEIATLNNINIDKLTPQEIRRKVIGSDLGHIIAYETTRNINLVDILDKHNMKILLDRFDMLNRQAAINDPDNFPLAYANYRRGEGSDIFDRSGERETDNFDIEDLDDSQSDLSGGDNSRVTSTNIRTSKMDRKVAELTMQRYSFKLALGYNMTLMEQIHGAQASLAKKLSLYPNFTSTKAGCSYTRWRLIVNSENRTPTITSHLYNDINRVSSMRNDGYMVDLIARVAGYTNTTEERIPLNEKGEKLGDGTHLLYKVSAREKQKAIDDGFSIIDGYLGRTTPNLFSTAGSFNAEICLFTNLYDRDLPIGPDNVLMKETSKGNYDTCIRGALAKPKRLNKIFNKMFMLIWFWRYRYTGPHKIVSNVEMTDATPFIKMLIEHPEIVKEYNVEFKDYTDLIIKNDEYNDLMDTITGMTTQK